MRIWSCLLFAYGFLVFLTVSACDSSSENQDGSAPADSGVAADGPTGADAGPSEDGAPASDVHLPGDAPACNPPWALCNGQCVDTRSDPDNCGGCGTTCPADQVCENSGCKPAPQDCRISGCPTDYYCDIGDGKCYPGCAHDDQCGSNEHCDVASHQCVCDDGFHACSSQCVSNSSVSHCGGSCSPCPTQPNASPTCDGTSCGIQCHAGYKLCGGTCAPCPGGPGVSATDCNGSSCEATACSSGFFLCATGCCGWTQEVVKTTTADGFTHLGLVLDAADQPRIVFNEAMWGASADETMFAGHHDGANWSTQQLVQASYIDVHSLTLAPGGEPTLGFTYYLTSVGMKMWLGSFSGSSWIAFDAQDYATVMDGVAVASRSDGSICRVYSDWNSDTSKRYIYYGCRSSPTGSWSYEEVGKWYENPGVRLELDSTDTPHVVFIEGLGDGVTYAYRSASGWVTEDVAYNTYMYNNFDLELDPQGNPAVAHRGWELKLARRSSAGVWTTETVHTTSGNHPVLRFDPQGDPVVSHTDGSSVLTVSRKGAGGWSHLDLGLWTEQHGMDVDSQGKVHLLMGDGQQLLHIHD